MNCCSGSALLVGTKPMAKTDACLKRVSARDTPIGMGCGAGAPPPGYFHDASKTDAIILFANESLNATNS